ncbi:MAG: hypothetical protein B0D82_01355, partial [Candidatus Sedimenticola endophacoides]
TLLCGFGPPYPADKLAADTQQLDWFNSKNWTPAELASFETAIKNARKSIKAMRDRMAKAKEEGRSLNQKDMSWLGGKTIGTPAGYRGTYYKKSPSCVKEVIDNYESAFNTSHYRDLMTHFKEALSGKGKGHMNKVHFNVEIGRMQELIKYLQHAKFKGMRPAK